MGPDVSFAFATTAPRPFDEERGIVIGGHVAESSRIARRGREDLYGVQQYFDGGAD